MVEQVGRNTVPDTRRYHTALECLMQMAPHETALLLESLLFGVFGESSWAYPDCHTSSSPLSQDLCYNSYGVAHYFFASDLPSTSTSREC